MSVNALTASEHLCRKILMHVAVEKGAKEGLSFTECIDYLSEKGYVTPPMKTWVEQIRKNGNLAAHKIASPEAKRAESTVTFTAQLLRLTYEMEYLTNNHSQAE